MTTKKSWLLVFLGVGCLVHSGWAQKAEEKVTLRVLATGQPPTTEIEVRGAEGSVEKDVDPDLLPPRALYLKGEGQEYEALRISLGVYSTAASGKRAGAKVPLYERGGTATQPIYRPWASLTVPPASKSGTVLMYQDPKKRDWKQPILKYLPDDAAAFPEGAVRLINSTPFKVSVQLGKAKQVLSPAEVAVVKDVSLGEPVRYSVTASVKGKAVKLANSALVLEGRASLVISPQDKPNSRRPARVKVFRDGV
jgi:hypothetical protein